MSRAGGRDAGIEAGAGTAPNPAGPRPRGALDAITTYVPGGTPKAPPDRALKLTSNENPYGPSPLAVEAARATLAASNRYPEPGAGTLRARLAAHHGVAPQQVLVGNGSDEVLYLLAWTYLEPGRRAVMAQPPYGIHRIGAQVAGAELVQIPLRGHVHDLPAMAAAVTQGSGGAVFVANPHNPTGTAVGPAALRAFVADLPPDCLVVVDEAYFQYVEREVRFSALELLGGHPGLVVTRTFSKAHGLAGMRVGYGVAAAALLEPVGRIRPPFNVSAPALAAAAAALDDVEHVRRTVEGAAAARAILEAACDRLDLAHVPSQANFVLVEDRGGWPATLAAGGITVRPGSDLGVPGWARVSLGRPEEMERVAAAMADALGPASSQYG